MPSPATLVRIQQRAWAIKRGIAIDSDGYVVDLADNLFLQLSPQALAEFGGGDGGELGRPGKRGKMRALHSSSALAYNLFEYWRRRDASLLATSLHLPTPIVGVEFERKYPTGLPGKAPNLDIVLTLQSGSVTAIESKFLEPYGGRRSKSGFKAKYLESESGMWRDAGCPNCQKLAERLYSKASSFRLLNAEQLLKHILGLAASAKKWELLYLWHEVPGPATDEHTAEAEEFARIVVSDGIGFRALSYQSVFAEMKAGAGVSHQEYIAYLGNRYFAKLE